MEKKKKRKEEGKEDGKERSRRRRGKEEGTEEGKEEGNKGVQTIPGVHPVRFMWGVRGRGVGVRGDGGWSGM